MVFNPTLSPHNFHQNLAQACCKTMAQTKSSNQVGGKKRWLKIQGVPLTKTPETICALHWFDTLRPDRYVAYFLL